MPAATIVDLHEKFQALGAVLSGLARPEPGPDLADDEAGAGNGRLARPRGNHRKV